MYKILFPIVILGLILTSCQNSLLSDLDSLYDTVITANDITPPEINSSYSALGDLTLKDKHGTKLITWNTSDHPGIADNGSLIQPSYPDAGIDDEITAVVTFKNGSTKTFTFRVIVPAIPIDDQTAVNEARDALLINYADGDDASNIRSDITLRTSGLHQTSISWNTSAVSAVTDSGTVTRPSFLATDDSGNITATITKGTASATKTFSITVLKNIITDAESVSEAINALTIGYTSGDSASSVTADISLAGTGLHGTSISWNTSGNSAIASDGTVTRPVFSASDATGNVVATVSKGSESSTKTFALTVIKTPATDAQKAQADKDALTITYSGGDSASSISSNISLPSSGSTYSSSISWDASSHSAISNGGGVSTGWWISGSSTVTGTVRATITNGATSLTKDFSLTVNINTTIPTPSGFSTYTSGTKRYISLPKVFGGDVIGHYERQYREYSGGSWGSWTALPNGTSSTSGDPVYFGWTTTQLPTGHYQFRIRMNRNGRTGSWGVSSEYTSF